ncbi:hypothetical protein GALMADRAFT_280147 [Galerina marginata CBS 339.88]|uniref:non-specific serine/threonine protein kinase n=1 Tax=Galerina marginata (strain CBS 339.88) TaxID=685588 RepID=A0A067SUX1_GALM3|nr:hypothetical protein GALMADRAFT_280147 [Galerina marginata CBS 339.88]
MYTQYPNMELVSYYCKGGYHPVDLDDVFHDRYRVVSKLGHGMYATVWLVEDMDLQRLASLKVLAAEVSSMSSEVDVLRHLRRHQEQNPPDAGAEHVVKVFDDFEVVGPNGTHRCIVTELLGPSLGVDLEAMYDDTPVPFHVTKRMVPQITRGVAYLHRCGIVHGDLHVGNVLLYHPKFEHLSVQDYQNYFENSEGTAPSHWDKSPLAETELAHLPKKLHSAPHFLPLLELCLASTDSIHVKICDFGEAFLYPTDDKSVPNAIQLNTARPYCAPEIIFREPAPGPPTDIWALAVLLHMVLSGNCEVFPMRRNQDKILLREMVLALGKLPDRWWTLWKERAEYFDEDGKFIGDRSDLFPSTGKLLKEWGLSGDDRTVLEILMRGMLRYEMEDRITADTVVKLIPASWLSGS